MREEIDYRRLILYCLLIGFVIGVLSSIPLIRLPNLCCLWIILGGFSAAFLYGRDDRIVEPAEGVIIGGLFGIVYGVAVNVATFLVNVVLNILGWGNVARGTVGGGLLNTLGLKIGLGGVVVIMLNIAEGVFFGGLGGLLYAASRESLTSKPYGVRRPVHHRRSRRTWI